MTSASLTGCAILLFVDEPLSARAIQRELQDEGAHVQTARALGSDDEVSAAVVDFAVSDGDAAEICAIQPKRRILFIVHSGDAACRDVHGAAAVIPKPVQPGALAAAWRGALPVCSVSQETASR